MKHSSAFSARLFALILCCTYWLEAATIERALNRMYNFDFNSADQEMNAYIAEHPQDPLGYTFRASALLFRELDRLAILEAEFFSSNKRVMNEKKLNPDAKLKERFLHLNARNHTPKLGRSLPGILGAGDESPSRPGRAHSSRLALATCCRIRWQRSPSAPLQ